LVSFLRKDELIQIHTFLIHIRTCIEQLHEYNNPQAFTSYESLNIGPQDVHKSKEKQKTAVVELYKGISKALVEKEPIRVPSSLKC